jgi:recombination protein RecT
MANLQDMKRQQTNNGALATPADKVRQKIGLLEKRKEMLGSGASGSIVIDREIRAASVMMMNSRDLQDATPDSFYTAVSIAINSGIGLCNGRGYLVAYRGKCSFVPGWKGLVDLVARTGRASVWTGVVYQGDLFEWELGDAPFLKHKPLGDSDNWQHATHVYAIGRVKDQDYPIITVWTINKVMKHLKTFNKVGDRHYALKDSNNAEMYARKVVLLQTIKYLPSSQDLENAVNAETAAETGRDMVIDGDFSYVQEEDHAGQPQEAAREEAPAGNDAPEAMFEEQQTQQRQQQQQPQENPAAAKFRAFKARLEKATDIDMLDADADLIKDFPEAVQAELSAAYRARREALDNPFPPAGKAADARAPQMNLE